MDTHQAIIEGLAKELGATCFQNENHKDWELDWEWNHLGPPTLTTIADGKITIRIPKVIYKTLDLADPNLLQQLRKTIKTSYEAHPIIYD